MAKKVKKRARSSITGRFIPLEEAEKKPDTSVIETEKKKNLKK